MRSRRPRASAPLCLLILAALVPSLAVGQIPDKSTPPEAVRLAPGAAPAVRATADSIIQALVDLVDEDSIYNFIGRLSGAMPMSLDYGTRVVNTRYHGTPGNAHGRDFIAAVLASYGYEPRYHFYSFTKSVQALLARPDGCVLAAGQDSYILRNDTGDAWERVKGGIDTLSATIRDIAWSGGESYVLVGNGGLCVTSDGSPGSFSPRTTGTDERLDGVSILAGGSGWTVGRSGTILRTTDGGVSWSAQASGTAEFLRDVHAFDETTATVVGDAGTVLRTADGGTTWTAVASGTTSGLNASFFVGLLGWAVGGGGTILGTTDGGATWTGLSSGTVQDLNAVSFADASHGWAVGNAGTVLFTADGGTTWTAQTAPWGTVGWRAVAACSPDEGWIGGLGGHILHTTDGGATWTDAAETIRAGNGNIYATKPGTTRPDEEIVLLGHFDSISGGSSETLAPGAEDNGSGVAAVMEAARLVKDVDFERTLTFLAVDEEEVGLIGADRFALAAAQEGRNIVAVLNFDMIGWDDSYLRIVSNDASVWLGDLALSVGASYVPTLNLVHLYCPTCRWSDHAGFWDHGYDAICGIESWDNGSPPQYHTPWDTLGLVNIPYNRECAQLGLALIATVAGPDTSLATGVANGDPDIPEREVFALGAAEPNPFNPSTTIRYTIPATARAELAVYNAAGRLVRTLFDEAKEAGAGSVVWAGDDDRGRPAPSGVYFYRLESGRFVETRKMVLVR